MSPFHLFALVPFLLTHTLAQTSPPSSNNTSAFEFRLLRCDNHLTQYGDFYADPSHSTNVTWNQIALFTKGILPDDKPAPLESIFHAIPLNATPYHSWEGFNTSTFFFPRVGPHGWLFVEISPNATAARLGERAGRVVFEGVEFNCAKVNGGFSDEGKTGCEGNYEFCAKYTYCQPRYECRRREYPIDAGPCYNHCWPQWPGGA